MYWTIEDVNSGLCGVADVGKPKPPEPEAAPELNDASLNDMLKGDAIKAYRKLGGAEFLMKNQDMLGKVLAKALLPDKPTEPERAESEFPPWIKAQRLAYQVVGAVAEDIGGIDYRNVDPSLVRAFLREYPQVFDFADAFLKAQNSARSDDPPEPDPETAALEERRQKLFAKPTRELPPPRNSKPS